MTEAANPRAVIGDNGAPEPTPRDGFSTHVADLIENARQFLDGAPITTQQQADEIGKLLAMCRQVAKDADKQRKAEKQPHADAAKAVDTAWQPLIAECDRAAAVAKQALAPFLAAEQARQDVEAAEARRHAEEQRAAAQAAIRQAETTDLVAREQAERLLKTADRAERAADRAEKGRATVAGGERTVTLRIVWRATITDRRAALQHYLRVDPAAFEQIIQLLADAEARTGPRTAPGITFTDERIAQ